MTFVPVDFEYSVYGVRLYSDTCLPELESLASVPHAGHSSIHVRLRVAEAGAPVAARWFLRSAPSFGHDLALCGKIEDGYLVRFLGLADFVIDDEGRKLRCARVEPRTSPRTLRHLLLDQVLPLTLNLLGHDVLHATAVETRAGVCAFIGPAGAGKSTLAASFAADGYETFCDDCLVVGFKGGLLCMPGYPGVRLRSDSFAALDNQPVRLSDVAGYPSKLRIVNDSGHFNCCPRPLIAIYRISRPVAGAPALSTACIERLTGREAFLELVSSTYVFDVTEPTTLIRHFRFIERLIAQVPVARLLLPNDFALLPAARRAILSELGEV